MLIIRIVVTLAELLLIFSTVVLFTHNQQFATIAQMITVFRPALIGIVVAGEVMIFLTRRQEKKEEKMTSEEIDEWLEALKGLVPDEEEEE